MGNRARHNAVQAGKLSYRDRVLAIFPNARLTREDHVWFYDEYWSRTVGVRQYSVQVGAWYFRSSNYRVLTKNKAWKYAWEQLQKEMLTMFED